MNWQSIDTAPTEDGVLHVRGHWVYGLNGTTNFDACVGYMSDGEFLAVDGSDYGWDAMDYTHWAPIPDPMTIAPKGVLK